MQYSCQQSAQIGHKQKLRGSKSSRLYNCCCGTLWGFEVFGFFVGVLFCSTPPQLLVKSLFAGVHLWIFHLGNLCCKTVLNVDPSILLFFLSKEVLKHPEHSSTLLPQNKPPGSIQQTISQCSSVAR